MPTELDTPSDMLTLLEALVAALSVKAPGGLTTIVVAGNAVVVTDLVTQLKAVLALYQGVATAETNLDLAVAARGLNEEANVALVRGVVSALKGMLGAHSVQLNDYGIDPDKEPAALTAQQFVERAAKAAATRVARGTTSKKKKLAIHGTVAPATTPASPGTPATTTKTST